MDGERIFGIDSNSDTLYIFSFDSSVDSPLIESQILDKSTICASFHGLLEISKDRQRMRPLVSDENVFELNEGNRIEFASSLQSNGSANHFVIDQLGRIHFYNPSTTKNIKIPSSVWNKRACVTHDGNNLILILCKDGNLALFHLDRNDFSVYEGALKSSSVASDAFCQFISDAECCSREGKIKRVLIGDDSGLLNIFRIIK